MFGVLYYILALLIYIISLPLLFLLKFKYKYKISIPARFFLKNNKNLNREVWFHACSVGEVKSLKPILDKLSTDFQISTITETGFNEAKKLSKNSIFLPFELFLPFFIKKFKTLVVIEAELWYMLFFIAKREGAKTILLNARVSERSFPKYLKLKWFYKKIFENIDLVFAQSDIDRDRLFALGAKNIEVIGNIKLAQNIKVTKKYKKSKELIVTAGSTHDGEEKLILESFLSAKIDNSKLILVPRHPERFDKVDKLILDKLKDKNITYSRFSKDESFKSDIILVDKLGELINIFAISNIAIIGGTFNKKVGGHNPLEPASFGCKIISGESYFNQKVLYKMVDNINHTKAENLEKTLTSNLKTSKVIEKIDLERVIEEIER